MKRILVLWAFVFITKVACAQQEAQYSQYIFNGLYINPAYAGYKEDVYAQGFYRTQWAGMEGAPTSYSASVDGAINHNKVGLGLMLAKDELGAQSSSSVYVNYAYHLRVGQNDSYLSLGVGAGFIQAGLDGGKLHAIDGSDDAIPAGKNNSILPDARLGLYLSTPNYFVGVSADNILTASLSGERNYLVPFPQAHYYLTAGAIFDLSEAAKLKPSILFRKTKGSVTKLDINTFLLLGERLWVGGAYKTALSSSGLNLTDNVSKANSVAAIAELFATDRIRIGYSYDYALTSLQKASSGSHEISVGIFLGKKKVESSTGKCYFF